MGWWWMEMPPYAMQVLLTTNIVGPLRGHKNADIVAIASNAWELQKRES